MDKLSAEQLADWRDIARMGGSRNSQFTITYGELCDLLAHIAAVDQERDALKDKVGALFQVIEHGDEKHRAWLQEVIADHFKEPPHETPPEPTV